MEGSKSELCKAMITTHSAKHPRTPLGSALCSDACNARNARWPSKAKKSARSLCKVRYLRCGYLQLVNFSVD